MFSKERISHSNNNVSMIRSDILEYEMTQEYEDEICRFSKWKEFYNRECDIISIRCIAGYDLSDSGHELIDLRLETSGHTEYSIDLSCCFECFLVDKDNTHKKFAEGFTEFISIKNGDNDQTNLGNTSYSTYLDANQIYVRMTNIKIILDCEKCGQQTSVRKLKDVVFSY